MTVKVPLQSDDLSARRERRRQVKLSRFLALILRHQPERFSLILDPDGWAPLSEVLEILHGLPNFRWVTRADVVQLVEHGSDDRHRFEIKGNRIRVRRPPQPSSACTENKGEGQGDEPCFSGTT